MVSDMLMFITFIILMIFFYKVIKTIVEHRSVDDYDF